ncbi:hypothetical protein AALA79_03665 [Lachnospiraceae bacterium 64-25]
MKCTKKVTNNSWNGLCPAVFGGAKIVTISRLAKRGGVHLVKSGLSGSFLFEKLLCYSIVFQIICRMAEPDM